MDYSKCDNYVVSKVGYRVNEYPDIVEGYPTYNLELKELHDTLIHLDKWLDHDNDRLQVCINSREVGLIPGMTFTFVVEPTEIVRENELIIRITDTNEENSRRLAPLSYRLDEFDNKIELFLDADYTFKRINYQEYNDAT